MTEPAASSDELSPRTPLRVLLFIRSFELGGTELAALRMGRLWAEAGCRVGLLCGRPAGPLSDQLFASIEQLVPETRRRRTPGHWRMARDLVRAVRAWRPDVVFCPGNSYTLSAVLARVAIGAKGPPIVAKISNVLDRPDYPAPMQALYNFWLKIQARMLAHFVAMSEPMAADLRRITAIAPSRVTTICDAVLSGRQLAEIDEIRAARPDPAHNGPPIIVGMGRLSPQKDFACLIEAFARVAPRIPHQLVILGEGDGRKALQDQIDGLGLAERISLAGFAPQPARTLAHADLFVLSSIFEGIPAALIEALACGLRVVATNCSPSVPALVDGIGVLVSPRAPAALAQAMVTALARPADGQAARSRALQFTDLESTPRYLALFRQLAGYPTLSS